VLAALPKNIKPPNPYSVNQVNILDWIYIWMINDYIKDGQNRWFQSVALDLLSTLWKESHRTQLT